MTASNPDEPQASPPGVPFLVGHRTRSPEIAARYVAAGVTYVELDVRMVGARAITTHYRPVLWSRGVLERDNARVRIRGVPPLDRPAGEVIDSLADGIRIVFDPKDREHHLRARLVDELAGAVDQPGRHVVSTRSLRDIEMFAAAGFRTWWTLDTPAQIQDAAARPLPADGVTVRQRSLDAAAVRALHTVTDTVVAWTARTVGRAHELVSFGVDGITTHNFDVMAAVRGR